VTRFLIRRALLSASVAALSSGFVLIGGLGEPTPAGAAPNSPTTGSSPPSSECPTPHFVGVQPTSISGPDPAPADSGTGTMTDASGTTTTMTGKCRWTATFPSGGATTPGAPPPPGPTVYVTSLGNYYQAEGAQTTENFNEYGVNCDAYTDLVNYDGGAVAETQLHSGYCNTDGYTPGEGNVQSNNTNNNAGPYVTVAPNFGQWYGSFAGSGDVWWAQFVLCSQDPVGQQNTYACVQWNAGPAY
jgi:hypothetical protein